MQIILFFLNTAILSGSLTFQSIIFGFPQESILLDLFDLIYLSVICFEQMKFLTKKMWSS